MRRWIGILLGMIVMLGSFFMQKNVAIAADKEVILKQINEARIENGLCPLIPDPEFGRCADIRAKEQREGLSHTRPDGKMWYSINPDVYGENLAQLTNNEQESWLIEAWMGSNVHRDNILSKGSRRVGIGILETENGCYVVMLTD